MIEQNSATDLYPAWMNAWNSKAAEIDEVIIGYFQETTETTGEALDEIGKQLTGWWDRQQLDPATKAEYEKAKSDNALFKAQLDSRVEYLIEAGRISREQYKREHEKQV